MLRLRRCAISILPTLLVLTGAAKAAPPSPGTPLYKDKSQPVEARVNDLLSRMTTEEKVHELVEDWGIPGNARLGIPPLAKVEAVHGISSGSGATIFPHAIALGAMWDTQMMAQVADVIGAETAEANTSQAWSPVLDVARDPRWGRVEETYGEDPYLVTRMGVAWISAYQAHNLIATPKHFAAHGAPLGGRDSHDVGYSERVMREVFLPPFRAAFEEAKAGAVMNAYTTWLDGVPDAESTDLLKGILREEWGFDGFVVSDCGSIENMASKFSVAPDDKMAAALAIRAGVSCNCGAAYRKGLLDAVHEGLVSKADLDFAAGRILATIFRLGLFDRPLPPKKWENNPGWNSPAHRQVALQAARESIVLLKNENSLLPLSKSTTSIAVVGPNADQVQTGDYSAKPIPGQLVSILAGIKRAVSPGTVVRYAQGCDQTSDSTSGFDEAVQAAEQSDVVVMVLGDKAEVTTGENHDRAKLDLPGVQEALLERIAQVGKPIVLVLVTGKPVTIGWAAAHVPAILETWYPGEQGGEATANVLFGDYNPAGRLPITFPRSSAQLPLYYNYMPSGRSYNYTDLPFTPLYRFGYGLSYTHFTYSSLNIVPASTPGGAATVSATVTNTGSKAGDEVSQLYISHTYSSVVTPVMELKGFQRLHLDPGQTQTVTFSLTPYTLSVLNRTMDRVLETGPVKILVGGASPEPLTGDGQKQKIGYASPDQGVAGTLEVSHGLSARFIYSLSAAFQGKALQAVVHVRNAGGITDVGEVKLFADGVLVGSRRFEAAPGAVKTLTFPVTLAHPGPVSLCASGKYTLVTRTVTGR